MLLDIERIAPCMPGAELTEVVGKDTYKGKIGVRLGPVALTFAGIVKFEEIDDAKHTARVAAQGTDAKGRGGANAASVFRLEPAGSGSKVLVHTNLTLSGSVAQYGRGVGIIQATADAAHESVREGVEGQARAGRCGGGARFVGGASDRSVVAVDHSLADAGGKADLGLCADVAGDLELVHRLVQAAVGLCDPPSA